jgi:hypothetical protein
MPYVGKANLLFLDVSSSNKLSTDFSTGPEAETEETH